MNIDIEGRDIEPGDLVILPSNSYLKKAYALYYTKSGNLILSCKRTVYSNSKTPHIDREGYHTPEEHNGTFNSPYGWGEMLILEKNCKLPESLQKYIRNGKI